MSEPATLLYRFPDADRIVSASVGPSQLIPLIDHFYTAYRCSGPDCDRPVQHVIELQHEPDVYRVTVSSGDWEAESEGDAVLFYEYELTDALLRSAGVYVHLHGTAVYRESRCMLLLGPSGAGKSTLAMGLFLSDWRTLADDALLIDPESGEVQPFERSVRVHESSLQELGIDPARFEGAQYSEPYLWLSPAEGTSAGSGRHADALVFLLAGEETLLERLSVTDTLKELLIARLSNQSERDFECLAELAAQVPGYRLSFGSFKEALVELEAL